MTIQTNHEKEIVMYYHPELTFLCDTFRANHVFAVAISQQELYTRLEQESVDEFSLVRPLLKGLPPSLLPNTVYHLTDPLELRYRLLALPTDEEPHLLFIGPYRTSEPSPRRLLELGEQGGIPPRHQRYFSEYYSALPLLSDHHPLWAMLHVFCERIWEGMPYAVRELSQLHRPAEPAIKGNLLPSLSDDIMVNKKAMEQRYAFENELIRAVEKGLSYMEDRLASAFSPKAFEKRAADPLRNAKNYCIIMNTLLRKAAERGGVHPLYLDRMSSDFATRIEGLALLDKSADLMREMFRSYCRLVREHTVQDLPPIVQQALLLIDADLSADLSPHRIAEALGVSLGYLSAIFHRATGNTVTEYIRHRRMEYAAYLLSSTGLQIQTIALHCGILDVQYFSKLFKKNWNCTPTEYRRTCRGRGQL